jgi:DEAD/DEAH box helicase domain-containing protein
VDVDYFTQAIKYTQVRILDPAAEQAVPGPALRAHGDVLVRSQVVGFKKIKFFTMENVGDGKLELPENEMHTTACWITLRRPLLDALPFTLSDRQDGMSGLLRALESVASLLLMCDPRDLGTAIGERPPSPDAQGLTAEDAEVAEESVGADLRVRPSSASATAIQGQAQGPAPTVSSAPALSGQQAREGSSAVKEFFEPNLYLYDAYPGGIGFSEPLFRMHHLLLGKTRELIAACPCERGCPSCVGAVGEKSQRAKAAALAILEALCS